jgi:putative acetyltransferase
MTTIRLAQASDLPELTALYRQTVLANAPEHYTPAQTQIWASFAAESEPFRQFILGVTTYVLVNNSGIVGFAGIGEDGHVASTYVRHDRIHQGLGSTLMQVLLNHARQKGIGRLYSEASEFSLGLFKKFGFRCYATEVVDRQGVQFQRYLVELWR